MRISKLLMFLALIFGAMTVSGCATTQFAGFSNAPLAQVAVVQHPRVNGGQVPAAAMPEIRYLSASCQTQIHQQVAGPVQSGVTGAATGLLGGASVGPAAHTAFGAAASLGKYSLYGAVPGAFGGALNGATIGGTSAASGIGTCTRDFWEESKKDPLLSPNPETINFHEAKYRGTFVEVVIAGKAWGNSQPRNVEPTGSTATTTAPAHNH